MKYNCEKILFRWSFKLSLTCLSVLSLLLIFKSSGNTAVYTMPQVELLYTAYLLSDEPFIGNTYKLEYRDRLRQTFSEYSDHQLIKLISSFSVRQVNRRDLTALFLYLGPRLNNSAQLPNFTIRGIPDHEIPIILRTAVDFAQKTDFLNFYLDDPEPELIKTNFIEALDKFDFDQAALRLKGKTLTIIVSPLASSQITKIGNLSEEVVLLAGPSSRVSKKYLFPTTATLAIDILDHYRSAIDHNELINSDIFQNFAVLTQASQNRNSKIRITDPVMLTFHNLVSAILLAESRRQGKPKIEAAIRTDSRLKGYNYFLEFHQFFQTLPNPDNWDKENSLKLRDYLESIL